MCIGYDEVEYHNKTEKDSKCHSYLLNNYRKRTKQHSHCWFIWCYLCQYHCHWQLSPLLSSLWSLSLSCYLLWWSVWSLIRVVSLLYIVIVVIIFVIIIIIIIVVILLAVDGQYGPWSEWTVCSSDCDGIQTRSRVCDNPLLKCNGAPCHGPSFQTQSCGDYCTTTSSRQSSSSTSSSEYVGNEMSRKITYYKSEACTTAQKSQ